LLTSAFGKSFKRIFEAKSLAQHLLTTFAREAFEPTELHADFTEGMDSQSCEDVQTIGKRAGHPFMICG
jgi:hypothetical protein